MTTGDNYSSPATQSSDAVLALDLKTGRIRWSRQLLAGDAFNTACSVKGPNCPAENGPDFDFGAPAILVEHANRDFTCRRAEVGHGLRLTPIGTAKIVWQTRVGKVKNLAVSSGVWLHPKESVCLPSLTLG